MKNATQYLLIPLFSHLVIFNAKSDTKPNIVFIMADDLGYHDLGLTGSDYYETPNIDRLAKEGIFFSQAYSSAANSAPSRACLMSGRYTPIHGIYTVSPSARGDVYKRKLIPIENTEDLSSDFITLAEALQQQGYECGSVGKWHLGDDKDNTGPLSQGFCTNIAGERAGTPYSYFYPYVNKKNNKVHIGLENGSEGEYLTDRLTQEAINFIYEKKDGPFFLYLSHHAVHTPLTAPDSLINYFKNKKPGEKHNNAIYAAMIKALDNSVGKIDSTLQDLNLADNTILIFFSDNGGSIPVTSNHPLRGGKGMPYEGGINVPLIIRWTNVLEAGTSCNNLVNGIDFYPSLVKAAGGEISKELDGIDIFSQINKPLKRDLFWFFPAYLESYKKSGEDFRSTPHAIIRRDEYKLIKYFEDNNYEMYNLNKDPYETKNIAGDNKKILNELADSLEKWMIKTNAPIPSELNPLYKAK